MTDPKLRHIHKATVRDRVLHRAIFRVLYPLFDRLFIFDSYACRVGKGTHRGVTRLEEFARKFSRNNRKNIFALKCDVQKFFDSIDHEILFRLMEQRVADPDVMWLVRRILESFEKESRRGLPLGNVTSQLFANIYLNELDQFAKHTLKLHCYIRYCDDFIILIESRDEAVIFVSLFREFLEHKLKLTLHPEKIIVRSYRQGIDFLGYVVRPYCRTLRTKTKKRILRSVTAGVPKQSLQSYLGVLKHCNSYGIVEEINNITNHAFR